MGGRNREAYLAYQREYRKRPEVIARAKAYMKPYMLKHRKRYQTSRNRYWLRAKYGMTPENYKDMLVAQSFKCAVCEKAQTQMKRKLVVDHNHKTGKIRGLLCNPCNIKYVDTIENFSHLIPRILEYLKRGE